MHATTYGNQWDRYLFGVLYAYCNTSHVSAGEKSSYLLLGMDCRTPTEAVFLPLSHLQISDATDYIEELTLALSSARCRAVSSIHHAQCCYKRQYD